VADNYVRMPFLMPNNIFLTIILLSRRFILRGWDMVEMFVVDVMFIATISYDQLFALLLVSPVPLPSLRNSRNENKPK
jgi:hypothetical protein